MPGFYCCKGKNFWVTKKIWIPVFVGMILTCLFLPIFMAEAFWPFAQRKIDFNKSKIVSVREGDFVYFSETLTQTVEDFLKEKKISINQADYIFPETSYPLRGGTIIFIKRATPIVIEADGKEIKLATLARNVEQAIYEADLILSHLDKVKPDKQSLLKKDLKIQITRINVEEITEEETIAFKTEEKNDAKLKWRKTRVEQEGEEGLNSVQYRITYTNGKMTSKIKLDTQVLKKPKPKIIAVGTKIEVGKVTSGKASWYAYTGKMACASVQFAKGTWLRVTNKITGKQIIVQVNDYGPDPKTGKIIDLDKVAFAKLAPLGAGVMQVKIEEILE